jgi:hypothetical protein
VLVRTTSHFELFARRGAARARAILNEQQFPGATLDCSQRSGRALAASPGIAAVRTAPVTSSAWRNGAGAPLAVSNPPAVYMTRGQVAFSTLRLKPGRVQLSLSYWTSFVLTLRVGAASVHLTPTLEPYGPLWEAAVISTRGGPVTVRLQVGAGHASMANGGAVVGPIYAVPVRGQDTIVPLKAACGRYVDWYRLAG